MRRLAYSAIAMGWAVLLTAAPVAQRSLVSSEQVKRGREIYKAECAICHRDDLNGRKSDGGPALRGPEFISRWRGLSVSALVDPAQELMPSAHPGKLGRQAYVDVIAYVLERNGAPVGSSDLPVDAAALKELTIAFGPVR